MQALSTVRDGIEAAPLKGHSVMTMNVRQTQAFLCDTEGSYTVAMYRLKSTLALWNMTSCFRFEDGAWVKGRTFEENKEKVLMLEVSIRCFFGEKNLKFCKKN